MGPSILGLLEASLDEAALADADALLVASASKVQRTRRGRKWDVCVVMADQPIRERWYHVSLEKIRELQEEDLELLVANDRPLESVRERLIISAGLNSKIDYTQITLLAGRFVDKFGGLFGVATK